VYLDDMTDSPLTKLKQEGNYLGGLVHQKTLVWFLLRSILDVLIVLLVYLLLFRVFLRLQLFQSCSLSCVVPDDQPCCLMTFPMLRGLVVFAVLTVFISALLTFTAYNKLFLRSTLTAGLTVVSLLFAGIYFGTAATFIVLAALTIFFTMYTGYRVGLRWRRWARANANRKSKLV